jgi:hypothetical protein
MIRGTTASYDLYYQLTTVRWAPSSDRMVVAYDFKYTFCFWKQKSGLPVTDQALLQVLPPI